MYRVIVSDRLYNDTVAMCFGCADRAVDLLAALSKSEKYVVTNPIDTVSFDDAKQMLAKRSAKQMAMCNDIADLLQEYIAEMEIAFARMTVQ